MQEVKSIVVLKRFTHNPVRLDLEQLTVSGAFRTVLKEMEKKRVVEATRL